MTREERAKLIEQAKLTFRTKMKETLVNQLETLLVKYQSAIEAPEPVKTKTGSYNVYKKVLVNGKYRDVLVRTKTEEFEAECGADYMFWHSTGIKLEDYLLLEIGRVRKELLNLLDYNPLDHTQKPRAGIKM